MKNLPETDWLEALPDAVLLSDERGKIVFANKVCHELLGWSPEDIRGETIESLVPKRHARHASLRKNFMSDASRRPMGAGLHLTALHRSGAEIAVDISLNPVALDGVRHVIVSIRDMRMQRAADLNVRLLSVAVEAAANGIVVTDGRGVMTWANPAACRMTGYALDELVGQSPNKLKSGFHDEAFYRELWTTVTAGNVWSGAIVNRRKDGSLYHEEQTIAPVRGLDGRITHFIAIKQDVTARVRAEEMLRTVYEAIRNAASGVAVADLTGKLTYVNPAMLSLWGLSREDQLIGCNVVDLWRDRNSAQDMVAAVLQERNLWTGDLVAKRSDDAHILMHVAAARNRDARDALTGIVFSFSDISDRKRAEEAMRQAEGQKAMLASIAAVCHHLGQPSTVIVANAVLLERMLASAPAEVKELLAETHRACNELQEVLQRLTSIDVYRTTNYLESSQSRDAPENKMLDI